MQCDRQMCPKGKTLSIKAFILWKCTLLERSKARLRIQLERLPAQLPRKVFFCISTQKQIQLWTKGIWLHLKLITCQYHPHISDFSGIKNEKLKGHEVLPHSFREHLKSSNELQGQIPREESLKDSYRELSSWIQSCNRDTRILGMAWDIHQGKSPVWNGAGLRERLCML